MPAFHLEASDLQKAPSKSHQGMKSIKVPSFPAEQPRICNVFYILAICAGAKLGLSPGLSGSHSGSDFSNEMVTLGQFNIGKLKYSIPSKSSYLECGLASRDTQARPDPGPTSGLGSGRGFSQAQARAFKPDPTRTSLAPVRQITLSKHVRPLGSAPTVPDCSLLKFGFFFDPVFEMITMKFKLDNRGLEAVAEATADESSGGTAVATLIPARQTGTKLTLISNLFPFNIYMA
ncbi:hypothetical protein B0H17DRAFT_1143956 [Mycena rosella]|uniref:Uncharacterized protein n=1 Tax=Mycena rosella TaxID=1033263 RepID=A0AAD7G3Y3_MYCRO|nr:hypothetical protein B0H17DRAFT_1143956 [Mycena rosella]